MSTIRLGIVYFGTLVIVNVVNIVTFLVGAFIPQRIRM